MKGGEGEGERVVMGSERMQWRMVRKSFMHKLRSAIDGFRKVYTSTPYTFHLSQTDCLYFQQTFTVYYLFLICCRTRDLQQCVRKFEVEKAFCNGFIAFFNWLSIISVWLRG